VPLLVNTDFLAVFDLDISTLVPEVLACHNKDLVLLVRHLLFHLGIIDYVVASHAELDVDHGDVHGVVVVPQVSGRLEVLVAVDLKVEVAERVGLGLQRGGSCIPERFKVLLVQEEGLVA